MSEQFPEDDLFAECASCGGEVSRREAFKEDDCYFHPKCAEVWRCPNCGEWNEKAANECPCGEKRPE